MMIVLDCVKWDLEPHFPDSYLLYGCKLELDKRNLHDIWNAKWEEAINLKRMWK